MRLGGPRGGLLFFENTTRAPGSPPRNQCRPAGEIALWIGTYRRAAHSGHRPGYKFAECASECPLQIAYERPVRPGRGTGTFSRDCGRRGIDPHSGELIQARRKMSQSPGGGRMGVLIPDNVPSRRQNQSPAPLGHPTTPAPPRKNPRQRHAGRRGQSLKGISILAQGSHRRWLPWVPALPTDQS